MTGRKRNRLAAIRVVHAILILAALAVASCASRPSQQSLQQTKIAPVDYAWLDSVNLELYQCSRALAGGGAHTLYLVGEMHFYNAPTSRFADSLLARLQPGLFMSEGADSTEPRGKLLVDFSAAQRANYQPLGYDQPELFRLAEARGIPVVWLEKMDTTTGIYAGITKNEAKSLEMAVAAQQSGALAKNPMAMGMIKKMLDDPEGTYESMIKMFTQMGIDSMLVKKMLAIDPSKSGIIGKRNELMAAKAISLISPEYGCILIRFGMGHSEGMIEELAKSDCECERQSLQAFLEDH